MGKLVTFSGIDGSGKSTQISILKNNLERKNYTYVVIWARGGWTPGIEFLKKLFRKDKGLSLQDKLEYKEKILQNKSNRKVLLVLSMLDLILYFGLYYRWLLIKNKYVICDRYMFDTHSDWKVNYKSFNFENWVLYKVLISIIPAPDHSILLKISAKESTIRCLSKVDDMTEPENVRLKKIQIYDQIVEAYSPFQLIVDGTITPEGISEEISKIIGV